MLAVVTRRSRARISLNQEACDNNKSLLVGFEADIHDHMSLLSPCFLSAPRCPQGDVRWKVLIACKALRTGTESAAQNPQMVDQPYRIHESRHTLDWDRYSNRPMMYKTP